MRRFIIDGYNLVHASASLMGLADGAGMEAARDRLSAELEEFAAREECRVELVFDAAGREGPATSEERSRFLTITYTAARQTADAYIEKLAYSSANNIEVVVVVTGDYDQQRIAGGAGKLRMPPREFLAEMAETRKKSAETSRDKGGRRRKSTLGAQLPDDVKAALERIRDRGTRKYG